MHVPRIRTQDTTRRALRIAVLYAAFGALWISLGDAFVALLVSDPQRLTQIQTWKGWAFIAVTATLVFFLARNQIGRVRGAHELFRDMALLAADYIWEQDENLRFREYTPAPRIKGRFDGASLIGKARWELPYLGMDEARWAAHRADLEARRPFRNLELSMRDLKGEAFVRTDGRTQWLKWYICPWRGVDGGDRGHHPGGRHHRPDPRPFARLAPAHARRRRTRRHAAVVCEPPRESGRPAHRGRHRGAAGAAGAGGGVGRLPHRPGSAHQRAAPCRRRAGRNPLGNGRRLASPDGARRRPRLRSRRGAPGRNGRRGRCRPGRHARTGRPARRRIDDGFISGGGTEIRLRLRLPLHPERPQ